MRHRGLRRLRGAGHRATLTSRAAGQEIVALCGAHALGRCHTDRSGYECAPFPAGTASLSLSQLLYSLSLSLSHSLSTPSLNPSSPPVIVDQTLSIVIL